eukprot:3106249-Pleurochrysis_carterae.AAC.1
MLVLRAFRAFVVLRALFLVLPSLSAAPCAEASAQRESGGPPRQNGRGANARGVRCRGRLRGQVEVVAGFWLSGPVGGSSPERRLVGGGRNWTAACSVLSLHLPLARMFADLPRMRDARGHLRHRHWPRAFLMLGFALPSMIPWYPLLREPSLAPAL